MVLFFEFSQKCTSTSAPSSEMDRDSRTTVHFKTPSSIIFLRPTITVGSHRPTTHTHPCPGHQHKNWLHLHSDRREFQQMRIQGFTAWWQFSSGLWFEPGLVYVSESKRVRTKSHSYTLQHRQLKMQLYMIILHWSD